MASFKVPCPSCESQVLIKNPSLVGQKVECPKCKYRFKVEEPADEAAKTPAKPEKDKKEKGKGKKDGEKKPKAAKGGNKKALGIGLAVAAVGLLGVGGYVMFGGDPPKPKPGPGPSPGPVVQNTNPDGDGKTPENPGDGKDGKKPEEDKGKKPDPAVYANRSKAEPTNLLPPDAVAVYRFDFGKLRQTPVGDMLFDPAVATLVKASMGFELGDIDQYYHCSVGAKDRAPVGVIRLKTPFVERQLVDGVTGVKAPEEVNGKTFMAVVSNPLIAAVGNALTARSLFGDVYERPPPAPAKALAYAVCVYDTQTVLVGEAAALRKHVTDMKNGYPEFATEYKKDAPPPLTRIEATLPSPTFACSWVWPGCSKTA